MSAPDSARSSAGRRVFHPRGARLLALCLAGAATGAGLGLLGRKWSAAGTGAGSGLEASAFPGTAGAPGKASPERKSGTPRDVDAARRPAGRFSADRILSALAADKGVEYWLHLLSAADGSGAETLARLAEALKDEPAALNLIGARWAQLDPAGMLAALNRREPPGLPGALDSAALEELQKILTAEWFRRDPDGLIKALGAIPGADRLRPARERLLALLAPSDPGRTLGLIVDWNLPVRTISSKTLAPWLRAHPREAMRLIAARKSAYLQAGDVGTGTLGEIAAAMADLDPAGALSQPLTPDRPLQSALMAKVMEGWARRDPAAAAAWLAGGQADRLKRNTLSQGLLAAWSKTDPRAAMDWADAHLSGSARIRANQTLIPALASADPAGAVDFVSGMPPGFARDEAVMQVTGRLLEDKGREDALANFQRLTGLTDPALRKAALGSAAWPMMRAAPREFMTWLTGPEGSQAPFSAFSAAAETLAQTDGPAAMAWASGLNPEISGEVRDAALHRWLESSPEAAGDWLAALPAGAGRQAGITTAAAGLASQFSPEKYAAWLDSLPASDRPAILDGINRAAGLDAARKAELSAKYK